MILFMQNADIREPDHCCFIFKFKFLYFVFNVQMFYANLRFAHMEFFTEPKKKTLELTAKYPNDNFESRKNTHEKDWKPYYKSYSILNEFCSILIWTHWTQGKTNQTHTNTIAKYTFRAFETNNNQMDWNIRSSNKYLPMKLLDIWHWDWINLSSEMSIGYLSLSMDWSISHITDWHFRDCSRIIMRLCRDPNHTEPIFQYEHIHINRNKCIWFRFQLRTIINDLTLFPNAMCLCVLCLMKAERPQFTATRQSLHPFEWNTLLAWTHKN